MEFQYLLVNPDILYVERVVEMKVLMLSADKGACSKYRLEEPAKELRRLGVNVEVRGDVNISGERSADGIVTVHEIQHEADIVVIARPTNNYAISFMEQARRQGMKCVVDIDDDFLNIHPLNMAYDALNPTVNPAGNWLWLERACRAADLLTVSTPALTRFNENSVVLRNQVPDEAFEVQHSYGVLKTPLVGWAGTLKSHPVDLLEVGNSVSSLVRRGQARFRVIGDGRGVPEQIGLSAEEIEITGYQPLEKYYGEIARLDIGLVPLEASAFNLSKSSLKGMEYSAAGVAAVMSPTPENLRLAEEGIGTVVVDWKKGLSSFVKTPRKIAALGRRSRELMWEKHRYVDHAQEWLAAYEGILAGQSVSEDDASKTLQA